MVNVPLNVAPRIGDLRYAKVGDLDAALAVEQQILRFDVPMHHVAVMRVLQPLAEPAPD